MNFEESNIQNLQELKSGLLKENDKIQRLKTFANGDKAGIEHLEEVENMSNEDTIGANYYLAQYLSQYISSHRKSDEQIDYEKEQSKLERDFMEQLLPFLSKQKAEMNNFYSESKRPYETFDEFKKSIQDSLDEGLYPQVFVDYIGKLTFDQSLKNVVDKLADISFKKIANNVQITEKDYAFIITKIALFIGDFTNLPKYNMLYLGLCHELSQGKDYGTFAESYLREKVLSEGLVDSKFYPEDETNSMKR